MELITLRVPEDSFRSQELFVAHSDVSLERGLEPGERIVVQDARSGGAYAATVAGIDYLLEDTVYTLRLRGRLPHGVAARVPTSALSRSVDVVDVLGMLAELKPQLAEADLVTAGA